ncbi:MAG: protein kinase [Myxococcales bacterium]
MEQVLEPGAEVDGRYVVRRLLGSGGMGEVYEAHDLLLGRPVALKVLPRRAQHDERARERLQREGRSAARIQHRHVVRVYEVGSDGESDYLAMELLQGEDLHTLLERMGLLSVDAAFDLFESLADALNAIHSAGVVHRDLKPRNVFLAREGGADVTLKVLDFGVAKSGDARDRGITRAGEVFGTLSYMSPEQLRATRDVDARSDLWSAGAILHEALTGKPPYPANNIAELALQFVDGPCLPVNATRKDVPTRLSELIACCLDLDAARRFQSAHELQMALFDARAEHESKQAQEVRRLQDTPGPLRASAPEPMSRQKRALYFRRGALAAGLVLACVGALGVAWNPSSGSGPDGPTQDLGARAKSAASSLTTMVEPVQPALAHPLSKVSRPPVGPAAQVVNGPHRQQAPDLASPWSPVRKAGSRTRPEPATDAASLRRDTAAGSTAAARTANGAGTDGAAATPATSPTPGKGLIGEVAHIETSAGALMASEF